MDKWGVKYDKVIYDNPKIKIWRTFFLIAVHVPNYFRLFYNL